jgi:hypothetical protein
MPGAMPDERRTRAPAGGDDRCARCGAWIDPAHEWRSRVTRQRVCFECQASEGSGRDREVML